MISKDSLKILNQFKKNKMIQYLVALIMVILLYKFYVWINTESTDNAYIQGDITLVSSEINGRVTEVITKENVAVKKGDIIARIDDTDYKAALEQAFSKHQSAEYALLITEQKILMEQTNLDKANENAKTAQINFDLAERDYKRSVVLTKDNFSSEKVLDTSKSALEQARNALVQSQLAIQVSQQNSELLSLQHKSNLSDISTAAQAKIMAEKDMKSTVVVSPIDGVTAGSGLRVGNFVSIGMPLIYVVPNNVYIIANFKETQVANFKEGMEVRIRFDAISGYYDGKIGSISPASGATFSLIPVDNATGNFTKIVQRIPVTINFDNGQKGLEGVGVGMSVSVSVDTR